MYKFYISEMFVIIRIKNVLFKYLTHIVYKLKITVKPVYKDHSREPENVTFMSSCPLYTG